MGWGGEGKVQVWPDWRLWVRGELQGAERRQDSRDWAQGRFGFLGWFVGMEGCEISTDRKEISDCQGLW